MIPYLLIIVGVFLGIVSIIDIKHKEIPAVYNTASIFVVALLIVALNLNVLTFGILAFIFAWLLYDFEFFSGIADLKITILIGLIIINVSAFVLFMFLILFYGVAYKIIIYKFVKSKGDIAFLPVYFVCYITLLIIHYSNLLKVF